MSIEVQNITKTFGAFTALRDVSFQAPTGELVALLGPSGSGKTTLLRIIAGLEVADAGNSAFSWRGRNGAQRRDRQVGFVFQHYALFQHMTVFENIAFGLRVRPRRLRPSARDIRTRVYALLQLVQLDWLADRYPAQLSGGQRQRVALARRSPYSQRCCCSMNLSVRSMLRCAKNCAAGSVACMTRCTSPVSSSPTIRKRPWRLRIVS